MQIAELDPRQNTQAQTAPKGKKKEKKAPQQVIGFLLELSQNHLKHFSGFVDKVLAMITKNRDKVDQSFIAGIGRDDDDETVVNATLALARGLGIDAIAEGVEDDQQAQFLAERGCPTLQGFLFGHPEPMDNFFMQATA